MREKKSKKRKNKKIDKSILDEIIRVDHAGEYGATRIYAGQLAIFGKKTKIGKTIQHMFEQEQIHIETFNKLIVEKRVRPTLMRPVWNVAGYTLGIASALMGEKAAMACTVAVEDVIGKHYEEQAKKLDNKEPSLKKILLKFRDDELEHHDIGIKHDAEKTLGYTILSKFIKTGCRFAIKVSKKI